MIGMVGHCDVQVVLRIWNIDSVDGNERAWLFANTPMEVIIKN